MTAEQELCQWAIGHFDPDEVSQICAWVQQIKRDERDRLIRCIQDTESAMPHVLAKAAADFVHAKMIKTLRHSQPVAVDIRQESATK